MDAKKPPPEMQVMTPEEEEIGRYKPDVGRKPSGDAEKGLTWDQYLLVCPRSRSNSHFSSSIIKRRV